MVDVIISINNGNEYLGTTGKSLTVNEQPKEVSLDFVAEELHHKMRHLEKEDITTVLSRFLDVAARMMAEGFGIQYTNTKEAVMMRMYTDARLSCQSINLAKAKELMPDVVYTEQDMVEHAQELVAAAGIKLRPYVEVQTKFHELLAEYKPKYNVKGTKEIPYVARTENGNGGSGSGDNGSQGGSGDNGNGGNEGGQGAGGLE